MTRDLSRADVTPIPKRAPFRRCSYVLCRDDNPCSFCRGKENQAKGRRKQRLARRGLNIGNIRTSAQLSSEENYRGYFRMEVKAGKQVKGVAAPYLAAEKQALVAKAMGDPRPFCMVAMPDDWQSEGLVIMRLSTFRREIEPRLAE